MMYHIQYVTGTNGQTGHLAERIRVLREHAPGYDYLDTGWAATEAVAMDEAETREALEPTGYPQDRAIEANEYSLSDPSWNAWYYGWELKSFQITYGPRYNPQHAEIVLNGVIASEPLTPALAARAARVGCGHRDGVTVWSNDDHGYRLYAQSARRLEREEAQ